MRSNFLCNARVPLISQDCLDRNNLCTLVTPVLRVDQDVCHTYTRIIDGAPRRICQFIGCNGETLRRRVSDGWEGQCLGDAGCQVVDCVGCLSSDWRWADIVRALNGEAKAAGYRTHLRRILFWRHGVAHRVSLNIRICGKSGVVSDFERQGQWVDDVSSNCQETWSASSQSYELCTTDAGWVWTAIDRVLESRYSLLTARVFLHRW